MGGAVSVLRPGGHGATHVRAAQLRGVVPQLERSGAARELFQVVCELRQRAHLIDAEQSGGVVHARAGSVPQTLRSVALPQEEHGPGPCTSLDAQSEDTVALLAAGKVQEVCVLPERVRNVVRHVLLRGRRHDN